MMNTILSHKSVSSLFPLFSGERQRGEPHNMVIVPSVTPVTPITQGCSSIIEYIVECA